MKKVKLTYYLVMLLSLISLVSVGFASWTVSDTFSPSLSGMIVVEDVMKVNDYITCSNGNIFDYSFFGFVDKKGNISNTGTLTAEITINVDKCKMEFQDYSTLEMVIILKSDYLNNFTNDEYMTLTPNIYTSNDKDVSLEISPRTYVGDSSIYELVFNLPSTTSGIITLYLEYTFTIKNIDYYSLNIYPILKKEEFNFEISAKITGIKGA